MPTTYKEMTKGATLSATAASLYTAPAGTQAAIHAASVNNPSAAVVTVNVYKGAAGSSANKLVTKLVAAGGTAQLPELVNHKLEPGTQLWADGNGAFLSVSGVEYVPG